LREFESDLEQSVSERQFQDKFKTNNQGNSFKGGDCFMGQWFGRKQRNSSVAVFLGGLAAMGMSLCAEPIQAAQLQFWRYSSTQNRLEFSTDEDVRPRVQIIPNPVRLIVDLPGVQLKQPTTTQTYGAAVRSVRVGQFDAQTARIVVQLADGYTVDPAQVKVSGTSASSWAIALPAPVALAAPGATASVAASPEAATAGPPGLAIATVSSEPNAAPSNSSATPVAAAPTASVRAAGKSPNTLEDIVVTPDGLFLRTSEAVRGLEVRRKGPEISFRMSGVTVSSQVSQSQYSMNYHGIRQLSVRQLSTQPPVAQLTLQVDRQSPSWLASTSRFGGVVLMPRGSSAAVPNAQRPSESLSILQNKPVRPAAIGQVSRRTSDPFPSRLQAATVQSLALGGTQLLIQANRPVVYTSGWEGPQYRITLQNAQPAQGLRVPQIGVGSALSNVTLRQEGKNFSILVTPTPGVRISTISRIGSQTAVLSLVRAGSDPVSSQPPSASSVFSESPALSQPTLPTPTGRRIVVIDPGHGNIDPGAIGIGGLKETDIVLAMGLEVARLLQQQGLQVYLTRTDESRDVDLPPRVALAEKVRASVFVSIHANSINLSRQDINGVETYYAPGSTAGADLAQTVLSNITRSVNIPSRGMHSARFYVIRKTSMPSTLIETGFVTGADDAPKLGDPSFQKQMAAAIARGIIEYLNRIP
jgi:N-acetylmuramoyl-L-alanine amidase